jgi:hypothetical protein
LDANASAVRTAGRFLVAHSDNADRSAAKYQTQPTI